MIKKQSQNFEIYHSEYGVWKWTVSLSRNEYENTSYFIDSITSPYGDITDVYSPIPYDILNEMKSSLDSYIASQHEAMSLSTDRLNQNLSIVEGTESISAGYVTITNNGAYGSLLQVELTNTDNITFSTNKISNLAYNQSVNVGVTVNTKDLVYNNVVNTFEANVTCCSEDTAVSVNVSVLPAPIMDVSPTALSVNYGFLTNATNTVYFTVKNMGQIGSTLSPEFTYDCDYMRLDYEDKDLGFNDSIKVGVTPVIDPTINSQTGMIQKTITISAPFATSASVLLSINVTAS